MATDDKLAADGRFIRQTYREVVDLIPRFREAIARVGLAIRPGTPIDALMVEMCAGRALGARGAHVRDRGQPGTDRPLRWSRRHPLEDCGGPALSGLPETTRHLELVLGDEPFIQHYVTRRENEDNNKVFELYMATLAMLAEARVEVEDPYPKKPVRQKNPDVIATFRGCRWGLACKALHALSVQNYRDHLLKGIQQIDDSPVDRGVVVVSLKNVLPFDRCWPIERVDGKIGYGCFDDHRDVMHGVTAWVVQEFHERIVAELGGAAQVPGRVPREEGGAPGAELPARRDPVPGQGHLRHHKAEHLRPAEVRRAGCADAGVLPGTEHSSQSQGGAHRSTRQVILVHALRTMHGALGLVQESAGIRSMVSGYPVRSSPSVPWSAVSSCISLSEKRV